MKKTKTLSATAKPPPTRDGVSPSCVVLPEGEWRTIGDYLIQRFPGIAPEIWTARLQAGEVIDAEGIAVDAARPYQPHLRVYYYRALQAETLIPFEETVIFQDDYIVVADKPHFLPVIPSGRYVQETLLVRLKRKLGIDTLAPIHRIDRETAGLVVFTIQPSTRRAYQDLFLTKSIQKKYEAIAPSRPELKLPLAYRSRLEENPAHFMQMREVPGEPNAETLIELIESRGDWARYRLTPSTGQKHQLRVQCAALGMPLRHDRIYPVHLAENSDDYTKPLQLLAQSIAFRDPISNEPRSYGTAKTLQFDPS